MVLGAIKFRPAVPRHDMAHQIIWLNRRFIVAARLVKNARTQWPQIMHVARYKLVHGTLVRKQHFLPLSKSPVSFPVSLVSDVAFKPALRDFSPNTLLRRLETVLAMIAERFKRNIERIVLQKLFIERINICPIERSSLGVVLLGRPDSCHHH